MFGLSLTELLVILAIVLLLFGTKKLKNLGGDLGGAIKGFRKAMNEDDKTEKDAESEPSYIEGEARREASSNDEAKSKAHSESKS